MVAEFYSKVCLSFGNVKYQYQLTLSFLTRTRDEREVPSPPGFNQNISFREAEASQEKENASLHTKRGWDMALGPWKQIPMNLFIMYMAGNSISIFPIMMVGMLFLTPVKAIFSLNSSEWPLDTRLFTGLT